MNVLHSSKKNFPPIKKVGFFGIPIDGRKSSIANNLICFIGLDLFHLTSRSSNKRLIIFILETQSCYDSVFLSVVRSQSTLCLIYLSSLIYGSLFITACILQGKLQSRLCQQQQKHLVNVNYHRQCAKTFVIGVHAMMVTLNNLDGRLFNRSSYSRTPIYPFDCRSSSSIDR